MAFETIANDYGLIGKVAIVSGAGGPIGQGLDEGVTNGRAAAILLATINIAGGFLVTQRMLRMFRR